MTAATVTTSTTTHSDRANAPRHRDDDRPTQYGPHFKRRAASIGRALDRVSVALVGAHIKETQQ